MINPDGYGRVSNMDGYNTECKHQLNVKLTEEDVVHLAEINKNFFENEAPNSMLGRILIRKGIQFYKNLKG